MRDDFAERSRGPRRCVKRARASVTSGSTRLLLLLLVVSVCSTPPSRSYERLHFHTFTAASLPRGHERPPRPRRRLPWRARRRGDSRASPPRWPSPRPPRRAPRGVLGSRITRAHRRRSPRVLAAWGFRPAPGGRGPRTPSRGSRPGAPQPTHASAPPVSTAPEGSGRTHCAADVRGRVAELGDEIALEARPRRARAFSSLETRSLVRVSPSPFSFSARERVVGVDAQSNAEACGSGSPLCANERSRAPGPSSSRPRALVARARCPRPPRLIPAAPPPPPRPSVPSRRPERHLVRAVGDPRERGSVARARGSSASASTAWLAPPGNRHSAAIAPNRVGERHAPRAVPKTNHRGSKNPRRSSDANRNRNRRARKE